MSDLVITSRELVIQLLRASTILIFKHEHCGDAKPPLTPSSKDPEFFLHLARQ